MQAGRELNAKVADALGYEIIIGEIDIVNLLFSNEYRLIDVDLVDGVFSTQHHE